MIDTLVQLLVGWFRSTLRVEVEQTDDIMVVDKYLGNRPELKWRGRMRVRSQRRRLKVSGTIAGIPLVSCRDMYDVTGTFTSPSGSSISLPSVSFPRIGFRGRLTERFAHSIAIESFVDMIVKLEIQTS